MAAYKEVLKIFQKTVYPSSFAIESEPSVVCEGPALACRRIVPPRGVDIATQTSDSLSNFDKYIAAREHQGNPDSSCCLDQLVSRNAWV